MKKSGVVFLIFLQIVLLFIFQNIHSLFQGIEHADIQRRNTAEFVGTMRQMKQIFSVLSILTAIFLISTAVYLGFLFKKSREERDSEGIPPLQTYLHELKDSQLELTDLVREQQDQVNKRDELNKSIVNSINSAIIFVNPAGRVEIFNPVAEELFSSSFVSAKNSQLSHLLKEFSPLKDFILDHQDERISQDITVDEQIFHVDMIPVTRIGTLIIIKEITEEKMRDEIDRRNRNFIQLGEMTAFLAHEVRNSLGIIYGYSKTIQSQMGKGDEKSLHEKIRRVNRELLALTNMMESFLHFSKPIQAESREPVDVISLLKTIGEEHGLSVSFPGDQLSLETDPVLIKSVFNNLFLNSVEAGADHIQVQFAQGPYLEIFIHDNGRGINDRVKEKIWYPLFTTKTGGTGMGLAIVRKIVSSLGGDIQLVSSSDSGSRFKIILYNP